MIAARIRFARLNPRSGQCMPLVRPEYYIAMASVYPRDQCVVKVTKALAASGLL